jgi:hypothetical protein
MQGSVSVTHLAHIPPVKNSNQPPPVIELTIPITLTPLEQCYVVFNLRAKTSYYVL